jgi:quinol monooxygenase YgiN
LYIVTVEFRVKPEHSKPFREQMVANARASREKEPGCRQFDVCVDPAQAGVIYLYEVYDDRAAFDAHLATAHFKSFDAAVGPWLDGKTVRIYERIDPR